MVLMAVPGDPLMDESTRKQALDLTAKGFAGTVILITDDIDSHPGNNRPGRGVQPAAPPDAVRHRLRFSDPSGNSVRRPNARGWPKTCGCEAPPPR